MNPKRCSEYPALGALFLSFALAGLSPGCAGTEESQTGVGSNTNPEDCVSAVSWYGALESSAETLVLQGCVNDECRTRTVDVDPSAQCKVKREWTNDWGSGACANVLEPSVVQVVFQLDLTLVSNDLTPGDIGSFTVKDPNSGEMLYQQESSMDYVGGVDAGTACWRWNLEFDDRTDSVTIRP